MLEPGKTQRRIDIPYFEGVNSLVSFNIGKKTEFIHAENARSKMIGTIEKREGQTVLGTNADGKPFVTAANYGLFSFQNNFNQGLYRISETENPDISISVSDQVGIADPVNSGTALPTAWTLFVSVVDNLAVNDKVNYATADGNTGRVATIYYINNQNQWIPLTGSGTNIPSGVFDYTYAENCVFLTNINAGNRYIQSDGTTVMTSFSPTGHLYNTPPASKINFYKNRLYMADFIRSGIRYKTTVLRSSYPMGVISLVNNDFPTSPGGTVTTNGTTTLTGVGTTFLTSFNIGDTISVTGETSRIISNITDDSTLTVSVAFSTSASGLTAYITSGTIPITDTKYFYTDTGANTYDVYRGAIYVTTLNVTQVNETSIVATWSGAPSLLASDEIWISGTYEGEKRFRWVSNPTISGKDVKQYDTFKLSGGENDEITMLTNIGNVMLISNKSAMASWNDFTLQNFDLDIGCVSKKGYVKMIGTLYYMHYTGVYATSGGVPQLISNKIEQYISGATKSAKENSAAGKKGRSIFFTLGDVTLYKLDGSINKILRDVCIEYNLTQGNWFIHTNVKASEFATFIESVDSDRLEFTDKQGNHAVKEFLAGDTDDGEIIHFRVDTIKLTMGINSTSGTGGVAFEYSNKLIALLTEAERGSAIQLYVNLENEEEYYPIEGTIRKGLSITKIKDKDPQRGEPSYCRLVSLSLRDSSRQLCKLSRMSLIFVPTTDEDTINDE
ncbi:MAG: hypothetical protein WC917_01730 [Bacilli bacterium]|jgi:hypothetical protein